MKYKRKKVRSPGSCSWRIHGTLSDTKTAEEAIKWCKHGVKNFAAET